MLISNIEREKFRKRKLKKNFILKLKKMQWKVEKGLVENILLSLVMACLYEDVTKLIKCDEY